MNRRMIGRCMCGLLLATTAAAQSPKRECPGGELLILGPEGAVGGCPLKHTQVSAEITGYVGRVTVRQTFHNPTNRKIEALYTFPLPQDAAVDDMTLVVGARRVLGQIRERGEAQRIYEAAQAAGHVAGLLEQERPNIFTQSVANIEPGVEVVIEISYVETLRYDEGVFTWVFPMVVEPRYIPGEPTSNAPEPSPVTGEQEVQADRSQGRAGPNPPQGTGWAPDTDQVPDASRITPPVVRPGLRAGHDIGLTLTIDAGGLPILDLRSELHDIDTSLFDGAASSGVRVELRNQAEIPNRDFVLHYRLGSEQLEDVFLVHEDERGRFFTLVLQPPQRVAPAQIVPRELIFVLDVSGSMQGFPIEKAKEVMKRLIDTMQPHDTFNLVTFAGHTRILWDRPRPNTPQNRAEMQALLARQEGGGGTEMMQAIEAALIKTAPDDRTPVNPVRVVCFMTDGCVGNDMAIIDAVKRHAGTTRVFSFGVGNSVNRFLLDGMARAGRGEVEYVTLAGEADPAVVRFHQRILAPVLTDIAIDWGTLPVADVSPALIPDLFSTRPIMVHGRLTRPAAGTVTLRGTTGSGPWQDTIEVRWPASPPDRDALASLWARSRIAELMMQDYAALQRGQFPDELKRQVLELGLTYRLMTQFTSFVAVEELTVTSGGEPVKVTVPVELPQGVSYEGIFGGHAVVDDIPALGVVSARSTFCLSPSPGQGAGAAAGGAVTLERAAARPTDATTPAVRWQRSLSMNALSESIDGNGDGAPEVSALSPEQRAQARLAEPLRGLAARVEKEGKDGTLTVAAGGPPSEGRTASIRVVNWRVDVIVTLTGVTDQLRAALRELGFEVTNESSAAPLLIGSIDVRKLEALAKLGGVVRVEPVPKL